MSGWIDSPETQGCWRKGANCRTIASVTPCPKAARRERLGTRVVSHKMHHAATALYGAHVPDRVSRRAHLHHYNEPFAYLFSDLLARLVDRLHALGYYDDGA